MPQRSAARRPTARAATLFPLALLLAVFLATLQACRPTVAPPRQPIAAEISRLEKVLDGVKIPHADAAGQRAELGSARRELAAGYLEASLYELEEDATELPAERYPSSRKAVIAGGQPAFEKEWRTVSAELERSGRALTDAKLRELPAAVRALVQSAREQSALYDRSALLYGQESGVKAGLYYLGLARGYLDYALFCAGLRFPPDGGARAAGHPPDAAIAALEGELLATYDAHAANHPQFQFNAASASLKLAGELARRGEADAALQAFLDAVIAFGEITRPPVAAADLARLQTASEGFRDRLGRLAESGADASIGRLYWQLAADGLATWRTSGAPGDSGRRAELILDDALPRYFAALTASAAGASKLRPQLASRQVTVTLVRWPFT